MKTMQCSMFRSRKKRPHYHPLPFPKPKLLWKCHQRFFTPNFIESPSIEGEIHGVAMRHVQPDLMRHYRSINPTFATWTLDKVIR
ncbi:hypothetical protein Goari_017815 [Gossypium aridum]|uniref:Uncharacterized protein n=1 Tax=Gossypium aridum TaxID=34290 RepID=A0A7J8WMV7_GOSAI|nr:hypothetical protein [Gossypium aridum]